MLRLIQVGSALPVSYSVDPTAIFQPGMIAQLKVMGNEIVCGTSDGTAPFGIIDDINTSAFTASVIDEVVVISVVSTTNGSGQLVSIADVKEELRFANIVRSSFVCDVEGLTLNDINGVITCPSNTVLNYDSDGDGTLDSVRVICSYTYRIPNIPGDNTTIGSSRMTVWIHRGIYETDQFDAKQRYAVNATLFCNADGLLTTEMLSSNHPGIGMVSGIPSSLNNTLEFIWF